MELKKIQRRLKKLNLVASRDVAWLAEKITRVENVVGHMSDTK